MMKGMIALVGTGREFLNTILVGITLDQDLRGPACDRMMHSLQKDLSYRQVVPKEV